MIASHPLSNLLPVGGAYLKFSLQMHAGQHAHDSALQAGTVWEMFLAEEGLMAAEAPQASLKLLLLVKCICMLAVRGVP